MCYFLHSTVRHENAWVFERNINNSKVEVKVGVEHFLFTLFNYFYITIWFSMKLEDALEVLPMLIPEFFLDWFVFI
jgi:hypothetical protein